MTAQAMSAGTAETRSGSGRQPASAFANGDAPYSLSQKDSRMTDTTEQQAVKPVRYAAIGETSTEGARWYIWKSGHGNNYVAGKIADQAQAHAIADELNRLASVSSASAEIPAGMKSWTGGDSAPDDWDGGSVLRADGQIEHPDDITIQQWKQPVPRCKWNIVAYTPARVLDLPEPVPATNQAGEERAAIVSYIRRQSDRGADLGNEKPKGSTARAAFGGGSLALKRVADNIEAGEHVINDNAALATQPATSQEGEACGVCKGARRVIMAPSTTQIGGEVPCPNCGKDNAWSTTLTIATGTGAVEALAATPTPPTLSEDLRESVARIVSPAAMKTIETIRSEWTEWMVGQVFGDGPHKIDKEKATERLIQDEWEELEPKRLRAFKKADAILAALARAQVKAS